MSFDTDFNFTPVVNGFNSRILELQSLVAIDTAKCNMLTTSSYASLLTIEIAQLNYTINNLTNTINGFNAIINEISRIQALSVEEKTLIYYFYSVLGISKKPYMVKLLFNTSLLSDPNVQAVYNDTTSAPEVKLLVAQALYNQFTVNTQYMEIFSVSSFLN